MKICKRILSFLLALTFCLNFFIPSVTSKEAEISQFKAFDLIIERQGAASNNFRFVSFVSNIPFDVTEDNVIGLLVSGTANNGTEKVPFVSKIVKSEFKDNTVIFSVAQTDDLKAVNQASYSFELKVYPELYTGNEKAPEISKEAMEGSKSDFEPFNLKIDRQGRNGEFFRFVVKASDIPFEVTSDNVKGLKVSGTVEGTLPFESEIGKVEIKDNGKTIIFSVKQTKDITSLEFEKSTFDLKVSPACYESEKPEEAESEIIVPAENRPDTDIAVNLDGNWLEFDVEPLIINGRTMVPMRAIFEALGCSVSWDQVSQTAIGVRNGKVVYCTINSNDASVDGKATTIDQPPALINGRTLVPLRFVSEAYGCTVQWDSDTRSIYIKSDDTPIIYYLSYSEFSTLGTWSVNSTEKFLQGISDSANENSSNIKYEPAKAVIRVQKSGKYRLWVKARDYSSNKPGSRYFNVAIDNNESATTFGKHGKEGFYWEDGGEFELTEGVHTISLLDTSAFYARCSGVLLTDDLDMEIPQNDAVLSQYASPYSVVNETSITIYPQYTKEFFAPSKTASIENANNKVVFYQGQTENGAFVQTEFFTKDIASDEWVRTKARNEEFGVLMKYAKSAELKSGTQGGATVTTDIKSDDIVVSSTNTDFYKFGKTAWLFPSDFEIISNTSIKLIFPENEHVSFSEVYEFDNLVDDLKITADATFKQEGDYSFAFYNGDGVTKEQFDTVTAPLLYIKHALPDSPVVLTENYMYTPMNTLHFKADNNVKTPGKELTQGLAVDPTSTEQALHSSYDSLFGTMFYSASGKVRPQLVAPMMGNHCSEFKAGENYKFSYRVINRFEYWYDTMKHVAVDMYNCNDIRINYYGSVNDTIYNTTELIMDDFYSGWDDDWMGYYNMEGQNFVSQSNIMSVLQRYLLTEDETILEERVIPTLAYALSRGSAHYAPTNENGGYTLNYITAPSPLSGTIGMYNSAVYGGIYEMTQGRMPYFLDYAMNSAKSTSVTGMGALYKYTSDESYKQKIIEQAEAYLESYPNADVNRDTYMVNGFVYGDYISMVSTLLSAYELTDEEKYLDLAEECGRLLMGVIWTTGYQNDFAQNEYHVNPIKTVEVPLNVDTVGYPFFWHGETKWRPGNVDGESKSTKQLTEEGIAYIPEETVPGWLATQTAHGAEHPSTPSHGNYITMNNWLGTMVRLSEYTGDEWFETQARNAIIGRYQNYPGYYVSRYLPHIMHKDYPYSGPDMTSVYWHHIPIFLSMVEDFLINEAWAKSNKNIDFPYIYQSGYAYFNSYQFGQAAGKFYDENDMWLWIEKDIVNPDNINIDYIAAKKDGVIGIAFMNEDNTERTTTVTLGEKIGENITTIATLYDADGNKSTVEVINNQFTVTVPSKGIMSVVIKNLDNIKTPAYVRDYEYSTDVGQTVAAHTNGYGHVIQVTDDKYWAYVYISDLAASAKSATLTYTVNGKTETITDDKQGYEWLIKVDNPDAEFTYSIEITKPDGTKENYGGGTLKTAEASGIKPGVIIGKSSTPVPITKSVPPAINELEFEPFEIKYSVQGTNAQNFRFVCDLKQFPFEVTKNALTGLKLSGNLVDGDKTIPFESYVIANEMRTDSTVLVVSETANVKASAYLTSLNGATHSFKLQLMPQ